MGSEEVRDQAAESSDEDLRANPVVLFFRHVLHERLARLFPPGARVLDVRCGTGEDAMRLASRGVRVYALGRTEGGIAQARARAAERGIDVDQLRLEVGTAGDLTRLGATFDGAYCGLDALPAAETATLGGELGPLLRPGAPVLLSLRGRWPLPATLENALTGGGTAPRRAEPGDLRGGLGPDFHRHRTFALGVLIPGPSHADWAARHPQAFGLLAMAERSLRSWPLFRTLGEYVVLEWVRS